MENKPSNPENAVTYQSKDFIGTITLNRPLKRNALNTKVMGRFEPGRSHG